MRLPAIRLADMDVKLLLITVVIAPFGKGVDQPIAQARFRLAFSARPRASAATSLPAATIGVSFAFATKLIEFRVGLRQIPEPAKITPDHALGSDARFTKATFQAALIDV